MHVVIGLGVVLQYTHSVSAEVILTELPSLRPTLVSAAGCLVIAGGALPSPR